MLLCIDPGFRACGVAAFLDGRLVGAAFLAGATETNTHRQEERADTWLCMAQAVRLWADDFSAAHGGTFDTLAIELPQVYQAGHQSDRKKGTDPNDLIFLAATVGAVSSAFANCESRVMLPREWKQQIPKAIHHERALKRLSEEEKACIPKMAASKLHNVLDAIAIGLWHSKRL